MAAPEVTGRHRTVAGALWLLVAALLTGCEPEHAVVPGAEPSRVLAENVARYSAIAQIPGVSDAIRARPPWRLVLQMLLWEEIRLVTAENVVEFQG